MFRLIANSVSKKRILGKFFSTKTYYECLGIAPNASQHDIKSAYLKLKESKPGDKTVMEAFEILNSPELRYKYDKGILVVRNGFIIEYDHSNWDDAVFRQSPLSLPGVEGRQTEKINLKPQKYEKYGVQWLIVTLSVCFIIAVSVSEKILEENRRK